MKRPQIVQKQRKLLQEAWGIIYAMEGENSWDRARKWLRDNYKYKPEGIIGAEFLLEE